jgi:hypothetical protein
MAEQDGVRAGYNAARGKISNTLHAFRVCNVLSIIPIAPELNQFQERLIGPLVSLVVKCETCE